MSWHLNSFISLFDMHGPVCAFHIPIICSGQEQKDPRLLRTSQEHRKNREEREKLRVHKANHVPDHSPILCPSVNLFHSTFKMVRY